MAAAPESGAGEVISTGLLIKEDAPPPEAAVDDAPTTPATSTLDATQEGDWGAGKRGTARLTHLVRTWSARPDHGGAVLPDRVVDAKARMRRQALSHALAWGVALVMSILEVTTGVTASVGAQHASLTLTMLQGAFMVALFVLRITGSYSKASPYFPHFRMVLQTASADIMLQLVAIVLHATWLGACSMVAATPRACARANLVQLVHLFTSVVIILADGASAWASITIMVGLEGNALVDAQRLSVDAVREWASVVETVKRRATAAPPPPPAEPAPPVAPAPAPGVPAPEPAQLQAPGVRQRRRGGGLRLDSLLSAAVHGAEPPPYAPAGAAAVPVRDAPPAPTVYWIGGGGGGSGTDDESADAIPERARAATGAPGLRLV